MESPLLCETKGQIRILRLNRPDRLNAVSLPMYEALEVELKDIATDEQKTPTRSTAQRGLAD